LGLGATRDLLNGTIDLRNGLVVLLGALHDLTFDKIRLGFFVQVLKNTRLRYYYPEERELPFNDPYKNVNPWYDEIFQQDFPLLEQKGWLIRGNGTRPWVRLLERGKSLYLNYLDFPPYSKLREEVFSLYEEAKQFNAIKKGSPVLRQEDFFDFLLQQSKNQKYESLLYDRMSLKIPFGLSMDENGKLRMDLDLMATLRALKEKIEKHGPPLRAPHHMTQLMFLEEVCRKYGYYPYRELPLVEINAQCINVKVNNFSTSPQTIFTLELSREGVGVIANNFVIEPTAVEYHGLKVIGIPLIARGFKKLEAIKIFDKGRYVRRN
jgi:hypothetical protein